MPEQVDVSRNKTTVATKKEDHLEPKDKRDLMTRHMELWREGPQSKAIPQEQRPINTWQGRADIDGEAERSSNKLLRLHNRTPG